MKETIILLMLSYNHGAWSPALVQPQDCPAAAKEINQTQPYYRAKCEEL